MTSSYRSSPVIPEQKVPRSETPVLKRKLPPIFECTERPIDLWDNGREHDGVLPFLNTPILEQMANGNDPMWGDFPTFDDPFWQDFPAVDKYHTSSDTDLDKIHERLKHLEADLESLKAQ